MKYWENMWRAVMLLAGWMPFMACAEVYFAQVTKVSDGDTVWVKPEGVAAPRKLRLQGLDAPEICQAWGQSARDALANMVLNVRVQVSVKYEDDYGRGLARLSVDGQDVGAKLVAAGHAWSSRWHRSLGPYAKEEAQAKAGRLGLFAQSQPETPRDFRKRFGSCFPAR
ncbi:MAG: thermonuclease family protein [Rhodoferax sp.]|jgi:endonuclease YncB( thermonuclease family)|nr:thermonuclease family protein [Rhodoferax sp.]